MAEKVGGIYYDASIETRGLIEGERQAKKSLDSMGASADKLTTKLTQTAAAAKTHAAASELSGVASRAQAASVQEAAAGLDKHAKASRDLAGAAADLARSLANGTAPMEKIASIAPSFGVLAGAMALAGAAAVVMGLGANKGAEELRTIQRDLTLTGSAAGVTADQIATMAIRLDALAGVTRASATAALLQFVAAGGVTGDSLERITAAAIRLEQAGGQSIEKTAEQFKVLEHDPLRASLKLNDSVNFLTESTYKQIRAAEEQGRTTDAARIAQNAYAEAINGRASSIIANLGLIERAWRGIKSATSDAWDAVLNIGRSDTAEQAVAKLQARIDGAQQRLKALQAGFAETAGGAAVGRPLGGPRETAQRAAEVESLQEQLRLLLLAKAQAEDMARAEGQRLKTVQAMAEWDQQGLSVLTGRERMERQIAQVRELGARAGLSELEIEKRISAIRAHDSDQAAAYIAHLRQEMLAGVELLDAQEAEAKRVLESQARDHPALAARKGEAMLAIEQLYAQKRRDLVLAFAEEDRKIAEQVGKDEIKESMDAQQQRVQIELDAAKGRAAARQIIGQADPVAALQFELEAKSALLLSHLMTDQDAAELYATALIDLERTTADKIRAIRRRELDQQDANAKESVSMLAKTSDEAYNILAQAGRQRTSLGKALFLASKALAVAEILINTEVAAAKAGAQLGIFGLPMAAMIRATGYASAGMVAGTAVADAFGGGRAYGGPVDAGSLYRVNEGGRPEMFTAASGAQYMMPTTSGRVTPADQLGGATQLLVQVINSHPTASIDVQQGDDGRVVRIAVSEVANQIAEHRGPVWAAMRGQTNVRAAL